MRIYILTLAGVVALAGLWLLQRWCARDKFLFFACREIKPLLQAVAVTGIVCSALQLMVLLSNDYAASSVMLKSILSRLRVYRALVRVFSPGEWRRLLLFAVLMTLVLYGLIVSALSARQRRPISSLRIIDRARTPVAWLASIGLFGSFLAAGVLQPRLAMLEAHAARIEQRYAAVVASASARLDAVLTAEILRTLDEQGARRVQEIWRRVSADARQLAAEYPNLYRPPDSRAPAPGFPVSPLIALPNRFPSVLEAAPVAGVDVRLERFAVVFAGSDSEDISQLELARSQSIGRAIQATRAGWSENNVAELERDLAATASASAQDSPEVRALARRTAVAMYEEAPAQVSASLPRPEWAALPWRFIELFIDAALDDEAREQLTGAANTELAEWIAGKRDWSGMASGYALAVTAQLHEKIAVNSTVRRSGAQHAIDAAAAEYSAARAQLHEDMLRYAADASTKRWAAVQQVWIAGATRLPARPRDGAFKVLKRVQHTVEQQRAPLLRAALLGKIEDPWRIVSAALTSESETALFQTVAAAIIVGESELLHSRQFADENRDAILASMRAFTHEHFSRIVGRLPKPSEGYKLDQHLQQMFADFSTLTAAAAQHLSHNDSGEAAHLRFASLGGGCIIEGMLTTSLVQSGFREPGGRQRMEIPCW